MTLDGYQKILEKSGGVQEILPDRKRGDLLQAWRQVYAAGLHAVSGCWKYGPFEWHVFSFEYARAWNGQPATAAYSVEEPTAVIVCPESAKLPAVRLTGGRLPDFGSACVDAYVWPEDLAWTMAFTHEESLGLGPYFCRREWVVAEPPARHRGRPKRG